jgi:23S rRNA (pseudouridine1915-N3)-methyltransferase
MMEGRDVDFIIGGAFGLDQSILNLANAKLCLSKMTLPHQMAKLMLVEQIYRARSIIDGHPYHK